ncbi:MAG: hypothetical protein WBF32_09485 [Candidatus Aminicenantaceae bacterium]
MFNRLVFCAILSLSMLFGLSFTVEAQSTVTIPNEQELEKLSIEDLTNQIRRDKFDLILPQVMREQEIDMWIHVMREGGAYSFNDVAYGFYDELGDTSGVFIFTDRGGDRIERAVLGRRWSGRGPDPIEECGAYDIIGETVRRREIPRPDTEYDHRFEGIGEFVTERNPKRIAVNYLDELGPTVCADANDGISHTDYRLLVKAMGEKYASRLVSSEYLEINYISRPVPSEIVMLKRIRKWIAESQERSFAKIVPGFTKVSELEGEITVMAPGRSRTRDDHVLKGGDLFIVDQGAEAEYDLRHVGSRWKYGNFFELVVQYGYVLDKGETDVPPEIRRIWDDAIKIRQITTDNIKVGRTGRETFEIITQELTEAGFNVNPVQRFHEEQDPEKTQVSIDLHALGKGSNAPRIGSIGPAWEHEIPLPLNHHFMMEFFIYRASPSKRYGSKYLMLWFHDGAIVTDGGVEFLSPPPTKIRLIR